jgi:hypothetical protein
MLSIWQDLISFLRITLLVLTVATLVKPITPIFETSSNASQFVSLENLIGSLHTYASEDAQLLVRDLGLTNGQRSLLERYQSVRVVSATYKMPVNARLIYAENELISVDDIFAERRAKGDLLYVDSIRKRFRLAVVIPFIRSQIEQLRAQLNMSNVYLPCTEQYQSVDLIFYHNEATSSSLENIVRQIKFVNKCYQNVVFLAANLDDHQNYYPRRVIVMWLKLVLEAKSNVVALRSHGYTHFFLMDPDTIPIRPFWLDAIVKQVTEGYCLKSYCANNWWMSGSIYRGRNSIDQHSLNIHGNALYHLSPMFVAYVHRFSTTYLSIAESLIDYDMFIFLVLLNNTELAKQLWHKFRFADFIQNCGRSSCQGTNQHDKKQFRLNHPHTFLIHDGSLEKDITKKENYNLQEIVLPSIIITLIILWWNQLYRRRFRIIQTLYYSCCSTFNR